MNNVKIKAGILVLALAAFVPDALYAHTGLSASTPADDSVVSERPENLELRFTEEVRLLGLRLLDSSGSEVDTGFSPAAEARTTFSLALPQINGGFYTVEWTVLGSDGHRVSGEVTFTYEPGPMGAAHSQQTGASAADAGAH